MLYFRFDKNKEDFKGVDHKSVFMGDEVYNYCDELFENGEAPEEYQQEYDDGNFDIIDEFIENELTLDGCSCFELNKSGIEQFKKDYSGFINNFNVVTVFDGDFIEYGHDGETVAKCNKIIEQITPEEFINKYMRGE